MNLALIGNPLSHSFSKDYFDKKFENESLTGHSYTNIELDNLAELKGISLEKKLNGFNVTIPFKEEIIKLLDHIDRNAAKINAVNVVKIKDAQWYGYNTDYSAFKDTLIPIIAPNSSALVLGSGGASKAIVYALKSMGIRSQIVSRTNGLNYDTLTANHIQNNNLIINTTPLGMYPLIDQYPNIPYEHINSNHLCYDLTYNPEKSAFLQRSEERGARIKNGHQMLEIQADKSWDIWNA